MHLPYCKIRHDGVGLIKSWWLNGKKHRINGPAVEIENTRNGDKYITKFWYFNGQHHREDGPAIEYYDGHKDWYYKDKFIDCSSQEEFEKLLKLKAFW